MWFREAGSAVPFLRTQAESGPPDFRGGVYSFIPPYAIGPRNCVPMALLSLPRVPHAGTGPVVLMVQ